VALAGQAVGSGELMQIFNGGSEERTGFDGLGTSGLGKMNEPSMRINHLPVHCLPVLFVAIFATDAKAESGLASFYGGTGGPGAMTCAHKTRRMGSMVTVSYHGHTIRCRVTDRGPFIKGRVIDVSTSAARALGMMSAGVVQVSLE
jgi:rare lipoprotein A